jgi:TPR repeat protein
MRTAFIALLLMSSCFAQEPRTPDAKSLYEQAMNKLTGVAPNRNEITGVDLMTQSANLGYEPAQVALGYLFETGTYTLSDSRQARDLYMKAAGRGSHLAEYLLGRLYYAGILTGGEREGEKWLRPAADAGNPFAAYLLGTSLYDRDPASAIPRFRAAAEQGLPYAQLRLAKALIDGRVLPVNKREAYLWFFVSREAGVNAAAAGMSSLEGEMGSTETEKAKTEARELQAKVRRSANAKQCTGWPGELDIVPTPPPLDSQRYCE